MTKREDKLKSLLGGSKDGSAFAGVEEVNIGHSISPVAKIKVV
ncbi:hypothetical protein ACFLY2_01180 [Patescibacteria group bacterium]